MAAKNQRAGRFYAQTMDCQQRTTRKGSNGGGMRPDALNEHELAQTRSEMI